MPGRGVGDKSTRARPLRGAAEEVSPGERAKTKQEMGQETEGSGESALPAPRLEERAPDRSHPGDCARAWSQPKGTRTTRR